MRQRGTGGLVERERDECEKVYFKKDCFNKFNVAR